MYLSDVDIRALRTELGLEADPPFIDDEQIGAASIDLRLSNVFWTNRQAWRPARFRSLDLRQASMGAPLRGALWKQIELPDAATSITLGPGQMILGRVHERIKIPPGYAGKIEGRSSFARIGLMVHCTGDFMNPGYEGRMPLQLVNLSRYTIQLHPFIDICQLMLVPLSSLSDRLYGGKYLQDDGGPSYWFKDKRINRLQADLAETSVPHQIQEEIVEAIASEPNEVVVRFADYFHKLAVGDVDNADAILQRFANQEKRRYTRSRILKYLGELQFVAVILAGLIQYLGTLNWSDAWWITPVLVISGFVCIRSIGWELGGYLLPSKIETRSNG